jgi:aminopeptidase N
MSLLNRLSRIVLCWIICFLSSRAAGAQATHYTVKLVPDFERKVLQGKESIEFLASAGAMEFQKQAGLQVASARIANGEVTVVDEAVRLHLRTSGKHTLRLKYTVAPARGFRWLDDNAGLFTAFYCEAWMVCDNSPGQRATLRLEIAVPSIPASVGTSGFRAVGPGNRVKEWRDREGEHFIFEQNDAVQTYLFSFGVSRLALATQDRFSIYAPRMDSNAAVFAKTADAYAFLRAAASVEPMSAQYSQVFLPVRSLGQEAASMALLGQEDLSDLVVKDDVKLMAHELAHQWWGVTVGIRSWSDFWLNEGFAEFMSDAFVEKHLGRAAYDDQIAELQERLKKLREAGKDRPLHWEKWKDAHDALGPIPYVKGALFLARLRTELGEEIFWRGIGLYTSSNVRRLVDSTDFERAMEKASGRDLQALFDEAVFH